MALTSSTNSKDDKNEVETLALETMTSTQKVAALLILLGPTTASEVLKNISDEDLLEQITLEIASLNKVRVEEKLLKKTKEIFLKSLKLYFKQVHTFHLVV